MEIRPQHHVALPPQNFNPRTTPSLRHAQHQQQHTPGCARHSVAPRSFAPFHAPRYPRHSVAPTFNEQFHYPATAQYHNHAALQHHPSYSKTQQHTNTAPQHHPSCSKTHRHTNTAPQKRPNRGHTGSLPTQTPIPIHPSSREEHIRILNRHHGASQRINGPPQHHPIAGHTATLPPAGIHQAPVHSQIRPASPTATTLSRGRVHHQLSVGSVKLAPRTPAAVPHAPNFDESYHANAISLVGGTENMLKDLEHELSDLKAENRRMEYAQEEMVAAIKAHEKEASNSTQLEEKQKIKFAETCEKITKEIAQVKQDYRLLQDQLPKSEAHLRSLQNEQKHTTKNIEAAAKHLAMELAALEKRGNDLSMMSA